MSRKLDVQLYTAAWKGDFAGVKAAVEAGADVNAIFCDCCALEKAAENPHPDALTIVKYLVEHGAKVNVNNGDVLKYAIESVNPDAPLIVKHLLENGADANAIFGGGICNALECAIDSVNPNFLDIVKHLVKHDADIHLRDYYLGTTFSLALIKKRKCISDYLLSQEDFLLSDVIPKPQALPDNVYNTYRKKAITQVIENIGEKGLSYAKTIAMDIETMLKNNYVKLTEEDTKALEPLVRKISSRDWVSDVQVSSKDFSAFETLR